MLPTSRYADELTLRALVTGLVLGIFLTPCNIYSGLKIGWSFNMSISAALLSYGFWTVLQRLSIARPWGLLESNINQTAASSAASIISGGLVAPIPALALVADIELPFLQLVFWVFSVSFLGIWVAYLLLNPFLVRSNLPLPAGVATAEVMSDIFAQGNAALQRVKALGLAAVTAGVVKLCDSYWWSLPRLTLPGSFTSGSSGQPITYSLKSLTLMIEPSPLLCGFGAIIGTRIGLSLLFGALLAWAGIAPFVIEQGWVTGTELKPDVNWFAPLVEWLLWPGVALMVTASITSFALLFVPRRPDRTAQTVSLSAGESSSASHYPITASVYLGLIAASILVVVMQVWLFNTSYLIAFATVPMALLMAVVAGRIVGETGIPPIGAIGQTAQLGLGIAAPGNLVANLTSANVAGGAAGQCADLLNDFKTGRVIGANPAAQVVAQCFGVAAGSLVGSMVYLALIPDPQTMLATPEWPAPAVVTWQAVAVAMQQGVSAITMSAQIAMLIAAMAGIGLALTEAFLPEKRHWIPSAPALGLAFVIPASISITMCLGTLIAFALQRYALSWAQKFLIAVASGLVAGESISGVASAILQMR